MMSVCVSKIFQRTQKFYKFTKTNFIALIANSRQWAIVSALRTLTESQKKSGKNFQTATLSAFYEKNCTTSLEKAIPSAVKKGTYEIGSHLHTPRVDFTMIYRQLSRQQTHFLTKFQKILSVNKKLR